MEIRDYLAEMAPLRASGVLLHRTVEEHATNVSFDLQPGGARGILAYLYMETVPPPETGDTVQLIVKGMMPELGKEVKLGWAPAGNFEDGYLVTVLIYPGIQAASGDMGTITDGASRPLTSNIRVELLHTYGGDGATGWDYTLAYEFLH